MKNYLIICLITIIFISCAKNQENGPESFLAGNGVFILNEGNFTWGNGSLSYYSYDSAKVYNELFLNINGRPLGDVPNSMVLNGNKAYIMVNNSGKIEVVNTNTLKSEATIKNLISPRNMAVVSSSKAYVTSMYSDSVVILNLTDNSIEGYINLRRTSESIVISGDKAYISNWVGGREVIVVRTSDNKVVDSVQVGPEPESMVLDRNKMLWVLCNGGWARTNFAELTGINTTTNSVEKRLIFPTKQASPSCLLIDGTGESLYFLEKGVHKMSITSSSVSTVPLIPEIGHYFYKFGVNPVNGDIFITDARDYQQNGMLLYYSNTATFISSHSTGIIPGLLCFKLDDKFSAK
jgi:DNA-binding beta-propeller fold protein YncE